MTDTDINDQFAQKIAKGIFRPVIRHITGSDPEERLAEAVAMTFEMFQRYARRGVLLDDGILVHHCHLRAVDLGRQLVHGGQRKRDVLDQRNYHAGKLELLHLDGLPYEDGSLPGEEDWRVLDSLVDSFARDPTPRLNSAIDLTSWLKTLPVRDQELLAARFAGFTLQESAQATDSSISAVFGRLKKLGAELAERADIIIAHARKARTKPRAEACTA